MNAGITIDGADLQACWIGQELATTQQIPWPCTPWAITYRKSVALLVVHGIVNIPHSANFVISGYSHNPTQMDLSFTLALQTTPVIPLHRLGGMAGCVRSLPIAVAST